MALSANIVSPRKAGLNAASCRCCKSRPRVPFTDLAADRIHTRYKAAAVQALALMESHGMVKMVYRS